METNIQDKQNTKYEMFKSYYVVWKLLWSPLSFCFAKEFKSYYVVWKRIENFCDIVGSVSLNRTM